MRLQRDALLLFFPQTFARALALSALALTACSASPSKDSLSLPSSSPSPAARITIFPSPTPSPTRTVPPPTPTPIPARASVTLNARSGPGATYSSIGLLAANQTIQVIGQDGSGAWYLILYPSAETGIGWVAAAYVQLEATVTPPAVVTPSPTASGPTGRVLQRLNVRSGPGLSFDALGVLEAETIVNLSGRNPNSTWLQILYPQGPGGRGWVSAAYVQAEDISGLPVLNEFGVPLPSTTAGPTPIPRTPTPTLGPARADGDAVANPSVRVVFSPGGTRRFLYSDEVSLPEGDAEDWIAFTPYALDGKTAHLELRLTCTGNGDLAVELWQEGEVVEGWGKIACNGASVSVLLKSGQPYLLRLSPKASFALTHVSYTLIVINEP